MHDPNDPVSLGGNSVRTLLEDQLVRIWVGTADGGLNLFDPENQNFTHYLYDESDPNSIGSDSVFKLLEDQDGTIWVGTFGGGLNHFYPETLI
jgi:ligand-binding sensor domain-containing protein